MAIGQRLIAAGLAALLAYTPSAWAFYAQASTPAGFSGSAGNWLYAAKRTDSIINGIVRQAAATSVNVGGQSVRLTAAYRLGGAARAVAAGIISLHPAVRIGLGIAAWIAISKINWNESAQTWEEQVVVGDPPDGYTYTTNIVAGTFYSKGETCSAALAKLKSGPFGCVGATARITVCDTYIGLQVSGGSSPYGACSTSDYAYTLVRTGTGCPGGVAPPCPSTDYQPITPEQAASKLSANPMPDTVPQELPEPSPLPVEQPIVNPSPGANPQPQPMRVPTGDPVPTGTPGEWRQPYTDIVPSPSPDSPWRVDVKPGDLIQTTPTPMPSPVPIPIPDPSDPGTLPTGTPRTEDQMDLCQKYPNSAMCQPPVEAPPVKDPIDLCLEHPEIVACQKLGEPLTPETIPNDDKQITLTPDGGWGSAGACPAPRHITLSKGLTFDIPLDLLCDFARMIRPLIVAMAYLGAAMMLVGAARRE